MRATAAGLAAIALTAGLITSQRGFGGNKAPIHPPTPSWSALAAAARLSVTPKTILSTQSDSDSLSMVKMINSTTDVNLYIVTSISAREAPWLHFSTTELRSLLKIQAQALTAPAIAVLAKAVTAAQLVAAASEVESVVVSGTDDPGTRRAALAALLLAGSQASPMGRDELAQVVNVGRRLRRALAAGHINRTRRLSRPDTGQGAPVFLLHISKAGGTSLCSLSHYNRCLEHPKANNCWAPGAGPVWFAAFTHRDSTCSEYTEMIHKHGLDIVANEGYLDGQEPGAAVRDLCSDMLHMTLLRHPDTRVISHMYQRGVKPSGFGPDEYKTMSITDRIVAKPEIANNYMVRVLLGKRAYYSPLGNLTDSDGERAISILAKFDLVLLLERKDAIPVLLEQMLGWWNTSDMDRKHGRRSHTKRSLEFHDQQLIEQANRLDAKLYSAGLTMFKLDWLVFGAEPPISPNTNGTSLTCANPKRSFPKK